MRLKRSFLIFSLISTILLISGCVEGEILEDLGEAPNFTLSDQNNQTVTLDTYEDVVLLINFIYTNCPDPEFCPLTTTQTRAVQDALIDKGYTAEDFHILSISFDWRYDGPNQMKAYGDKYGANFSVWSFLSGTENQIGNVTEDYGVVAFPASDNTTILVHSLLFTLVDKFGHQRAVYTNNEWKVDKIVGQTIQLINENE